VILASFFNTTTGRDLMSSIHPAQLEDYDIILTDEEALAVEQRRQAQKKFVTPTSASPQDETEDGDEPRPDHLEKFKRDFWGV
jgi:hypothetical protein